MGIFGSKSDKKKISLLEQENSKIASVLNSLKIFVRKRIRFLWN